VDSAAVLGALVERARAEAEVAVGFLASISKGQRGAELTEMAELADAGAAGFSDDGVPVASAGLMRRALQYAQVTGRRLALHRGGHAAPLVRAGRGLPAARREREDDPAAPGRERPRGAPRRLTEREHLGDSVGPCAPRAAREGGAVRGGALRRDRPRDRL